MPSKKPTKSKSASSVSRTVLRRGWQQFAKLNLLKKAGILLIALVMLVVGSSYGISYWYLNKHRNEPLQFGTTFVPRYARHFGLDPQQTLYAAIHEVGFERLRLVSYWDDIEKTPGVYDFAELDWQIKMAEEADVDVSLALGLRQPRWPECHMPSWAKNQPKEQWYPQLKAFMGKVVERYKDSPAIISYQVENEFFMTVFGDCPDHSRDRLVDEYNYVRSLDPDKKIIITRSNNWGGIPLNEPKPDQYGVAVYKRVFDYSVTNRYFEYPYPPWFYGTLAGASELNDGRSMIIHELQMEPWLPEGYEMNELADIPEQNKSMNGDRLEKRFRYAADSGIRTVDTWGMEWWYWRKVKAGDSSLWDVAKAEVGKANEDNVRRGLSN